MNKLISTWKVSRKFNKRFIMPKCTTPHIFHKPSTPHGLSRKYHSFWRGPYEFTQVLREMTFKTCDIETNKKVDRSTRSHNNLPFDSRWFRLYNVKPVTPMKSNEILSNSPAAKCHSCFSDGDLTCIPASCPFPVSGSFPTVEKTPHTTSASPLAGCQHQLSCVLLLHATTTFNWRCICYCIITYDNTFSNTQSLPELSRPLRSNTVNQRHVTAQHNLKKNPAWTKEWTRTWKYARRGFQRPIYLDNAVCSRNSCMQPSKLSPKSIFFPSENARVPKPVVSSQQTKHTQRDTQKWKSSLRYHWHNQTRFIGKSDCLHFYTNTNQFMQFSRRCYNSVLVCSPIFIAVFFRRWLFMLTSTCFVSFSYLMS